MESRGLEKTQDNSEKGEQGDRHYLTTYQILIKTELLAKRNT